MEKNPVQQQGFEQHNDSTLENGEMAGFGLNPPAFQLMASPVNAIQMHRETAVSPIQMQKTVSGHGSLARDPMMGTLVDFQVPQGKTVLRAAPPGATLGNLSMVLNQTQNIDPAVMRALVKVNTTPEFWTNRLLVHEVEQDGTIPKTALQSKILAGIVAGTTDYGKLSGGEKGSLAALERRKEFEAWAQARVVPECFKEYAAGSVMNDMVLTPFEPALRAQKNAQQNSYVGGATTLSQEVGASKDNYIVVNACSHDSACEFTGFQIDA